MWLNFLYIYFCFLFLYIHCKWMNFLYNLVMSCMFDVCERRCLCTYYYSFVLVDKNIDCFVYLTVCCHIFFCAAYAYSFFYRFTTCFHHLA
jgi:hypothetical protein